jgi:hypothetical protein
LIDTTIAARVAIESNWMRKYLALMVLGVLMSCASAAFAGTVAADCEKDLVSLAPFLLENDAGAPVHLADKGQEYFDLALASARAGARLVTDDKACDGILRAYLGKWRKGHLEVGTVPAGALTPKPGAAPLLSQAQPDAARMPTLRLLSAHTLLLTLPSFWPGFTQPLQQLLSDHHADLASHSNWMIDVRNNDGGADTTYASLMPWLMADESVQIGGELLATPANIAGQERVCALFYSGDKDCLLLLADSLARMRKAAPGSYVPQQDDAVSYERQAVLEPQRPSRVAVLIDHPCGSSCEQFVLAVKQSFSVKLVGRNTYGVLDYSNLRPHALPSGRRLLFYAISRSQRLPAMQVDLGGIMPDIYLPAPVDQAGRDGEVERVRKWLEGGSLTP